MSKSSIGWKGWLKRAVVVYLALFFVGSFQMFAVRHAPMYALGRDGLTLIARIGVVAFVFMYILPVWFDGVFGIRIEWVNESEEKHETE